MTLNTDLRLLVVELECEAKEYLDKQNSATDENKRQFFKGKYDAYSYSAHELRKLLEWHSVMEAGG